MGLLFLVCFAGGCGSIIFYAKMSLAEIEEYRRILKEIEYRKKEADKLDLANEIIRLIKFDFSSLINKPINLKIGYISKCKFCQHRTSEYDFYISFKAYRKTHFVCKNCIIVKDSFGRYQPRSNYISEIFYIHEYIKLFNKFSIDFLNQNSSDQIRVNNII